MASRTFWIQELVLEILKYADISSIISVGHSNKQGQIYMQKALADSIGDMLKPYFAEYGECEKTKPNIVFILTVYRRAS